MAIGVDMVAMHVLSTALATRVAYSYGFDVKDDEMRHLVDRMVLRTYRNQVPKARTAQKAGAAFHAGKGRIRRSDETAHRSQAVGSGRQTHAAVRQRPGGPDQPGS